MRIHHLNCISSCPLGGRLMDGRAGSVDAVKPWCTPGLRMYQTCAHDPAE